MTSKVYFPLGSFLLRVIVFDTNLALGNGLPSTERRGRLTPSEYD